ncbi:MAG: lecithin retinol acyltransferase family protein [Candidatus Hydrogenedentes bacterium]|nr:lecithin retinol acyltransferase family protein [Candidatus Hydrogenedentota bacterium]
MARGDHIRVKRFGYWHHGIDCGDGTVIHFTGEPRDYRNAAIRRTSIEDFAKGGRVRVVRHRGSYDPEVVVERAESRLEETGYHPVRNNCEHFTRWCVTGAAESRQIRRALYALTGFAVTLAGTVTAAALLHSVRRRSRRSDA